MSIAISDDHQVLADTVGDFLRKRGAVVANPQSLAAASEERPDFWSELAALGWLGLHLPEEFGGSGYGMLELAIVVEQMGREVAPGPFVPTTIASSLLVSDPGLA